MLHKPIDKINIDDIQSLVDNEVQENKTLDYKWKLSLITGDEKREFLKDVSSFSNSDGGYIIFGIKEENGIAKEVIGFETDNLDAELLKIENILRDNIEPRIIGIQIKHLKLTNGNFILIIKIPQSFNRPHVVKQGDYFRFFSRNSSGKYSLDISELRNIFQSSFNIVEKIKSIRFNRVSNIMAKETPIELEAEKEGRFIVHVIPLSSVISSTNYDLKTVKENYELVRPLNGSPQNIRLNFDGVFTYASGLNYSKGFSYNQFFRNGIIEATDCLALETKKNDDLGIYGIQIRNLTNQLLSQTFKLYELLNISPPVYILITFLGVSEYYVFTSSQRFFRYDKHKIGKDTLFIPEIVFEEYENINETMSFAYDCLWNAGGWEKAME